MAPKKQNPLLAAHEAMLQKRYDASLKVQRAFVLAAAMMAANDIFGIGKGRAEPFQDTTINYLREIAKTVLRDSEDDDEVVWSKAKVEQRLRQIMGDELYEKSKHLYEF